ncbi:MAG TPA: hypothetical protein DCQ64_29300 [Candidatus Rokubacteria bacterium]|nr:hypothetical protein [Candidatus Rokubacteria bacterium]
MLGGRTRSLGGGHPEEGQGPLAIVGVDEPLAQLRQRGDRLPARAERRRRARAQDDEVFGGRIGLPDDGVQLFEQQAEALLRGLRALEGGPGLLGDLRLSQRDGRMAGEELEQLLFLVLDPPGLPEDDCQHSHGRALDDEGQSRIRAEAGPHGE